jgi:predicted AAA+ superfamily ATPase
VTYSFRLVDDLLGDVFPHLAAVALEGAKGVGKTATARRRATTVFDLTRVEQREALGAAMDAMTAEPPPVLIDEWQLLPEVWDRVRRAVDDDSTGGRFLLTGSAGASRDARIHSGAGRIARVQMRPLSITERGIEEPTVSLRALLDDPDTPIQGTTTCDGVQYAEEILRSGFPAIRNLPEQARTVQLDSYIDRIIDTDLAENGVTIRRPRVMRAWLAAYGAATATEAAYSTILDSATANEPDKPARQTVDIYREHLTRLVILDPVEPWIPVFNPLGRLATSMRHHLVDPALAARMAGLGRTGLLRGDGSRIGAARGTWLGALFESLTVQSVRTYAIHARATIGSLRTTDTKREIDIVVEAGPDRVVAIEVKLAESVGDGDVRHLNWLRDQIGARLINRVIVTTGSRAYRRSDGVAVVPLALLGP